MMLKWLRSRWAFRWVSSCFSSRVSGDTAAVVGDEASRIHHENGEWRRTHQIAKYLRQVAQEEREWGEFGEGERAAVLLEEIAKEIEEFRDLNQEG